MQHISIMKNDLTIFTSWLKCRWQFWSIHI